MSFRAMKAEAVEFLTKPSGDKKMHAQCVADLV